MPPSKDAALLRGSAGRPASAPPQPMLPMEKPPKPTASIAPRIDAEGAGDDDPAERPQRRAAEDQADAGADEDERPELPGAGDDVAGIQPWATASGTPPRSTRKTPQFSRRRSTDIAALHDATPRGYARDVRAAEGPRGSLVARRTSRFAREEWTVRLSERSAARRLRGCRRCDGAPRCARARPERPARGGHRAP